MEVTLPIPILIGKKILDVISCHLPPTKEYIFGVYLTCHIEAYILECPVWWVTCVPNPPHTNIPLLWSRKLERKISSHILQQQLNHNYIIHMLI